MVHWLFEKVLLLFFLLRFLNFLKYFFQIIITSILFRLNIHTNSLFIVLDMVLSSRLWLLMISNSAILIRRVVCSNNDKSYSELTFHRMGLVEIKSTEYLLG